MKLTFAALLCLLLLLQNHSNCEAGILQKHKTNVTIINDLQGGGDLTLHCKSRNDDLGSQTIHSQASWSFYFRPDLFCTTLYFCRVEWAGVIPQYTDIYDCGRDYRRCTDCTWSITADRPCLFNPETNKFDLCEKWNP